MTDRIYDAGPIRLLHYITLHYITLHYITLHYIVLCYVMLCYVMFVVCCVLCVMLRYTFITLFVH